MIDVDPQGTAGVFLGIGDELPGPRLYQTLLGGCSPADAIRETDIEGIHVLPAGADLAAAELSLPSTKSWQLTLSRVVDQLEGDYDLVVIDAQPGLGVLSLLAIAAASHIYTPCPPSYPTVRLIPKVMSAVMQADSLANHSVSLAGVVPWMVGRHSLHQAEALEALDKHYGTLLTPQVPERVAFKDAALAGQPITVYAPRSAAAEAVRAMSKEALDRARDPSTP